MTQKVQNVQYNDIYRTVYDIFKFYVQVFAVFPRGFLV